MLRGEVSKCCSEVCGWWSCDCALPTRSNDVGQVERKEVDEGVIDRAPVLIPDAVKEELASFWLVFCSPCSKMEVAAAAAAPFAGLLPARASAKPLSDEFGELVVVVP